MMVTGAEFVTQTDKKMFPPRFFSGRKNQTNLTMSRAWSLVPPMAVAFRSRSPVPSAADLSHAEWSWLSGASLQAYAAAENDYSQSVLRQLLRPLQRALTTEMMRRQQSWQTYAEHTPPERVGAFEYGTSRAPGADVTALPVLFRRPVASPDRDQLVLDARDLCAWLGVDSFVHIGAS